VYPPSITNSCGSLGGGGFFGEGGVVAFSVDGGDFAAHGTEISGELAAVVNGVVEAEPEKKDCGLLEDAAEVDDFSELFAGKFCEGLEIFGVGLFVPIGNFGWCREGIRNFNGAGIEDAVDGSFEKEIFGDGDMADQFDGGFGAWVGLVRGFIGGNSFQDFFGGAGLRLERGKKNIVKQEVRLFWSEIGHGESPFSVRRIAEVSCILLRK